MLPGDKSLLAYLEEDLGIFKPKPTVIDMLCNQNCLIIDSSVISMATGKIRYLQLAVPTKTSACYIACRHTKVFFVVFKWLSITESQPHEDSEERPWF